MCDKHKLLNLKQDEVHYLDQIYKYMKHLEYLYKTSIIKDNNKAHQINISIQNIKNQRDQLIKEINEEK